MTRTAVILWLVALFVGAMIPGASQDLLRGVNSVSWGLWGNVQRALFHFPLAGVVPLIWWMERSRDTGPTVLGFSTEKARGPLLLWAAFLVLNALIVNYGALKAIFAAA